MVQLNKVTKKIKDKTIVKDLTIQINQGEVFGLLGPNGAGKSTTIRMMVGLISISAGDILINGRSISKEFQEAIGQVGAIVENPEFYQFLSGYQNLIHYANFHPKVTRERIDEVSAMVGLSERIADPVRTYSLGMRQRLGLAQALLHRPSVLILDEPTNGLDPAGIRELRQYLRRLAEEEGVAVIISSHLLAEMELICDRVAFIKEGRLLDVKTVGNDYREQWVAFEVDHPERAGFEIQKTLPGLSLRYNENILEVLVDHEKTAVINEVLIKAGLKVYGIIPRGQSLEDLFMEVTTE